MAASTLAASTAHLGRTSPTAAEELVAVSSRCAEFAETITAAALYDWDSPQRLRELSASRMPTAHEVAEIASRLYRAVAPALDLPHPDPEAVRLASLASQIAPLASDASHAERKSVLATAGHRWCCRPRTAASLRAGMRRSPPPPQQSPGRPRLPGGRQLVSTQHVALPVEAGDQVGVRTAIVPSHGSWPISLILTNDLAKEAHSPRT